MSTVEARELATRAHGDQRDRDGTLHIDHVARVAQGAPMDDAHQRVAWLHDVIEDCGLTIDDLEPRLSEAERDALVLLTRDDELDSYADYVHRIADATGEAGTLARAVKEADMLDNLRRSARDRDVAVARYGNALAVLWSLTSDVSMEVPAEHREFKRTVDASRLVDPRPTFRVLSENTGIPLDDLVHHALVRWASAGAETLMAIPPLTLRELTEARRQEDWAKVGGIIDWLEAGL